MPKKNSRNIFRDPDIPCFIDGSTIYWIAYSHVYSTVFRSDRELDQDVVRIDEELAKLGRSIDIDRRLWVALSKEEFIKKAKDKNIDIPPRLK